MCPLAVADCKFVSCDFNKNLKQKKLRRTDISLVIVSFCSYDIKTKKGQFVVE